MEAIGQSSDVIPVTQVQNSYFIRRHNGMFDHVESNNWVLVNTQALAKICDKHVEQFQIEDFFKTPQTQTSKETMKKIKKTEMQMAGKKI